MSAEHVSTTHVDAMLTGGLQLGHDPMAWYWPPVEAASDRGNWTSAEQLRQARDRRRILTRTTAGRIGAVLLNENARSVDHRYDADEIEAPYLFTELPGRADPVVILKAIAFYTYHSSEHTGWTGSEAETFCTALRHRAIQALPGYDTAPWGIEDHAAFRSPSPDPGPR
ncbi:hypothetical protein AB0H83_45880 [Dactylosporangium sp. NPDC050688]|uniref:hypothetical protein n=1 Tax=Dactylosporangium sp. NPDC050688 TaxID=3157217 RepID=UPI0033DF58E7